jgi:acetyltransferase
LLQWFGSSNVGFSWLVSTGDESATGIEELMQAMVDDDSVRSIMLFLEGVRDGAAFRRAALAARRAGKPVTMLHVGKTEKGREAVASHTGRVAGTREVFAAMARETGIIETESLLEFFGTARTMAQRPHRPGNRPRNRRAAVVTVSGGAASLSADQLYARGWNIPEFQSSMVAALAEATGQAGVHNPADIGGVWRNPEKMRRAITAIAQDDNIDAIFVSMGAGGVFAEAVAEAIVAAAGAITQDVFVAWVGMSDAVKAIFDKADIPAFADFPLAISAAEACARFSESQGDLAHVQEVMKAIDSAPQPASQALSAEASLWTVVETLHDLRRSCLPCAAFESVDALDPKRIVAAAARVGFPVVLKLSSPDLNHKSDDGGVAIGLDDAPAVEAAVERFRTIADRKRLSGAAVLVQAMAQGVEVLVGLKRDPSFGLVLVVGLGGTLRRSCPPRRRC